MLALILGCGASALALSVSLRRALRLLWLSHFVPYPPKGGAFQRNFHLLTRVARTAEVHFIGFRHKSTTHPADEVAGADDVLRTHCRSVSVVDITDRTRPLALARTALRTVASASPLTVRLFESADMAQRISAAPGATPFDVVHLETISMAQYLPCLGSTPGVLSHQGAESFMLRRRVAREPNIAKKAFYLIEARRLARYERALCPRFAVNVVVSDLDEQLMRRTAPDAKYVTVDNGVDLDYFRQGPPRRGRRLVFAGRLDQHANRDAVSFFVRDVWPRVRRRYADAQFDVVGNHPPPEICGADVAASGVRVHGFIHDVRPVLDEATAYVCPIRDGGGTRIKVLDAMASCLPIIATTVACEGLKVTPERDLLIADTAAAFESQIARVFDSATLRHTLGRSARTVVEQHYSWNALADKLLSTYREVASRGVGPRLQGPNESRPRDNGV